MECFYVEEEIPLLPKDIAVFRPVFSDITWLMRGVLMISCWDHSQVGYWAFYHQTLLLLTTTTCVFLIKD